VWSYLSLTWVVQQAPGCDMVLVHDDDLARIDGMFENIVSQLPSRVVILPYLWPQGTLQPGAMMDLLQESKPNIIQHVIRSECLPNNFALSQPRYHATEEQSSSPETETEATRVAMFSKEFQEWSEFCDSWECYRSA
jgi:hypothetical protein